MNLLCDCCEGPRIVTPLATANRPGLSALRYRVATHATFFATMQARLSNTDFPELAALKTREKNDPGIAVLDAWATVGDVLTFYQERIANEGYLRTATERRSVLELARLIGYVLRPGVSASVYLAYSIEKDAAPVEIPTGARANSVPAPGEQMQAFETAEPLEARVAWNTLKPRLTQPQTALSIAHNGLYLKGTSTKLKANDPLLIDLAIGTGPQLMRIEKVEVDDANQRTRVVLRGMSTFLVAAETVKGVIARYSAVERFDVSADAAMTKRVLTLLRAVASVAEAQPHALAAHLETSVLPKLEQEARAAEEGHFDKLAPWLGALAAELRDAHSRFAPAAPATARFQGGGTTPGGQGSFVGGIVETLKLAPSVPPRSARQLARAVETTFDKRADTIPRLLAAVQPALQKVFYIAWKNLPPPIPVRLEAYALRTAAAPFGHNAPLRQVGFSVYGDKLPVFGEWEINNPTGLPSGGGIGVVLLETEPINALGTAAVSLPDRHTSEALLLDNDYDIAVSGTVDDVVRRSYLAIETQNGTTVVELANEDAVMHRSLAAYGLSGKTTQINLPSGVTWLGTNDNFAVVRNTRVYAGSEPLELAEAPVTDDIEGTEIELDQLYEDLQPGRWLIVAGERTDIKGIHNEPIIGVKAAELVMLASVEQKLKVTGALARVLGGIKDDPRDKFGTALAGDQIHTFITLAKPLAYTYKRDTVTVYGNVVKATNGESRQEVIGSGDAAKAFQIFPLKQPPLTYVSAPTVTGVESTLKVRVNEVEWHEADSLAALGPDERKFITRTDDDAKTAVVFGNGERGARLPTGQENVKATYRNGIGKPGNVKAGQITLLSTRPLGVKEVINPIRASGGADKEGRDQARKNAPLAVMALDRLVSTPDYADFARTFGGIGKATAVRLTAGRKQFVHVTIAGAEDIPIEETSDLYRNLRDALHRYGDPHLPILLKVRERLALVMSAKVRIDPDYLWESLEPKIRQAMLNAFGFEKLELGDDLLLAEAIRVIQAIRGVSYVDVDVFDTISEAALVAGLGTSAAASLMLRDRIVIEPARIVQHQAVPAQLAYLAPDVPDTLILQEIKP